MKRSALEHAFHEVSTNTPAIVEHTAQKFGPERAKRQEIAIALSKARRGYASGGPVGPMQSTGFQSVISPRVRQMANTNNPLAALQGAMSSLPPQVRNFVQSRLQARMAGGSGPTPNTPLGPGDVNRPLQPRERAGGMGAPGGMGGMGGMGFGGAGRPGGDMMRPHFAEGGQAFGTGMLAKRKAYNQYVIQQQSEGEAPVTFEEWVAQTQDQRADDAALAGAAGEEEQQQQEPGSPGIVDLIMNKLRSLHFAMGGPVMDRARAGLSADSGARLAMLRSMLPQQRVGGFGAPGQQRAGFMRPQRFQGGGQPIDPELLRARYYENPMIPEAVQRAAAEMRANRGEWPRGNTEDQRERLMRLRAILATLPGGRGRALGGAMEEDQPEVGSRAELLRRMHREDRGRPQYAAGGYVDDDEPGMDTEAGEGGGFHHVDPYTHGGFTHETADDVYTFDDGGPVPGEMPMPGGGAPPAPGGVAGPPPGMPGMPPGMPPPGMPGMGAAPPPPGPPQAPPGADVDQAIGALAQLGQQLLKERTALQGAWQIPPPQQGPPPGAGGPPMPGMGGGPPAPGGAPAGPPGANPMVQAGLEARMTPNFARGGPVNARLVAMAARDPRLQVKLTRCGGGRV